MAVLLKGFIIHQPVTLDPLVPFIPRLILPIAVLIILLQAQPIHTIITRTTATAGSNTYYPAAQTYSPAATGYTYTTNATTIPGDVSGLYQGNWARNYSSTGAQTVGRTSNGGSMMRSLYDIVRSSNSTSTTAGTCGGGGGSGNGSGGGLLPITLDLTQAAASVNGAVTFFAENNTAKTIPVSGTIENGNVLNLSGTTAGDIADPALYGYKNYGNR